MFGNRMQNAGDAIVHRYGEVIDVDDPYRAFRVKVRVFGMTDDKRGIPDEDLPWYSTMMPVTSPSLAGAGTPLGLEKGSKVSVLFLDFPSCQNAIVMGSYYPGPSSPSHISPLNKGLVDKGPPIPFDSEGNKIDLGMFGNIGLIDRFNDAFSKFTKMFDLAQIFKSIQIFKMKK